MIDARKSRKRGVLSECPDYAILTYMSKNASEHVPESEIVKSLENVFPEETVARNLSGLANQEFIEMVEKDKKRYYMLLEKGKDFYYVLKRFYNIK